MTFIDHLTEQDTTVYNSDSVVFDKRQKFQNIQINDYIISFISIRTLKEKVCLNFWNHNMYWGLDFNCLKTEKWYQGSNGEQRRSS